jgi:RNA polymerase sigma factor (sigma-70 family)
MPSAYAQIPPDRPASEGEALELYQPVVGYWVARSKPNMLRDYQDIRQDALWGVIMAWRTWEPDKGMTFKSWTVFLVKQWVFSKGSSHFGLNLQNAYTQNNLNDRLAILEPRVRLDEIMADWKEDRYGSLADPKADEAFDLWGLSFDSLVDMVKAERDRFIVREYYLKERTYEDIGSELGITREYVRQRLQVVYKEIREELKQKRHCKVEIKEDIPLKPIFIKIPPPQPRSPLLLTEKATPIRMAEVIRVTKRTVYRWIRAHGKEAVINMCNTILSEFEDVVRLSDLAQKLKVSKSTVYRLVAEGKIRSLNILGSDTIRIPITEVRRLYNEAHERMAEPIQLSDKELTLLFGNKEDQSTP